MLIKHKNTAVLVFIILYTLFYYGWITIWQTQTYILTLGGNFLSIVGPLLATYWLIRASKRSSQDNKPFWLLLAAGTFSFVVAEVLWLVYESLLMITVPYPGSPDIFYILNILFYLTAFTYKLKLEKKHLSIAKFVFDIILVMTVSTTFFWYFLIQPLLNNPVISLFELVISLFYPMADLALLFFILLLYFNGRRIFHKFTTFFLLSGVLVQITADVGFLIMETTDSYTSGSWLDPLFILGILFIGYTGLLQKESFPNDANNLLTNESSGPLRMLFPYIYVSVLFIYMLLNASTFSIVTLGAGITIIVIIVRQLIVLFENKRLIRKYETQTKELLLSEERYKSLFAHHPDAVFSLDLKGHVLSVNETAETLLGVKQEKLIGRSIMHFVEDEHKEKVVDNFYNTKNGVSQHYDFTITNTFGRFLYINVTHIPIMVKKELVGVFAIAQDITQNKLNEQRIHYMAYHDALTDLANRTLFEEQLADQIKISQQNNTSFAVLFMDLNNFKTINDTHGHSFGDELLTQIGRRISTRLKDTDSAARLGGDEFTLLLTDIPSREDVKAHIKDLFHHLSHPYHVKGKELKSIPSIGYSLFPDDGTSVQELLSHADEAMYTNKEQSKQ